MPHSCAHPAQAHVGDILRSHVDRGAIAGAVALTARGDAVHVETAGMQSIGGDTPMRRESIFRIMSMTKPITAAAAMILVEDRRIALGDAVDRPDEYIARIGSLPLMHQPPRPNLVCKPVPQSRQARGLRPWQIRAVSTPFLAASA